jgi:hypothetical protein
MNIGNYVKRDAFLGEAFTMAVNALQIADDNVKKEAVAKYIVWLAADGRSSNATDMRDRAIKAFGGPSVW